MKRLISTVLLICAVFAPAANAQDASTKPATETATFAAGCYWCVESDFDKVRGVLSTESGFMGGTFPNPTYQEVSTGRTGHTEVVRVTYNPSITNYESLLAHYWVNVDPVDGGGQFCDRGSHYRPAIFTYNDDQKRLAEASKQKLVDSKRFDRPIAVEIVPDSAFTPAPDQDFYKTNSIRYKYYRAGCGRDARLSQVWGDKPAY